MLVINVSEQEFYDPKKEMFFKTDKTTVRLEHSLISIAKWESEWEKPYLATPNKSTGVSGYVEEVDYIRCMIIGKVSKNLPEVLLQNHGKEIKNYIRKKHSATTIHRGGPKRPNTKVITAELIYYWMLKFGIPFECQQWHFNRLLMLIDVCNVKENKEKSSLKGVDAAKHRHAINKARQAGLT